MFSKADLAVLDIFRGYQVTTGECSASMETGSTNMWNRYAI